MLIWFARYRFILKGDKIEGFYGGNSFANQIGITTQVPRVVEIMKAIIQILQIVEVKIGDRRFYIKSQ